MLDYKIIVCYTLYRIVEVLVVQGVLRKNSGFILLMSSVAIVIMVVHIITMYAQATELNNGERLQYDSIKTGDLVAFDATINGKINLHTRYDYVHKEPLKDMFFYNNSGTVASYLNVYYCKDSTCLDTKKYDKVTPLMKTGGYSTFSYKVLSYEDVFSSNKEGYTSWEAHMIPKSITPSPYGYLYNYTYTYNYGYPQFHYGYSYLYGYGYGYYYGYTRAYIIGQYYDIILTPTKNVENTCSCTTENEYEFSKEVPTTLSSKTSAWYNMDNTYYYDESSKLSSSDENLIYTFNAKKGQKVVFDLKTNSENVIIQLNGKNMNKDLKLVETEDIQKYFVKYVTKEFEIQEDGNYTLSITHKAGKDNFHKQYLDYVYVKDLRLLQPVNTGNVPDSSKFTTEDSIIYELICPCCNDTVMGKYTKELIPEPEVEEPENHDTVVEKDSNELIPKPGVEESENPDTNDMIVKMFFLGLASLVLVIFNGYVLKIRWAKE